MELPEAAMPAQHHAVDAGAATFAVVAYLQLLPMIIGTLAGILAIVWYAIEIFVFLEERRLKKMEREHAKLKEEVEGIRTLAAGNVQRTIDSAADIKIVKDIVASPAAIKKIEKAAAVAEKKVEDAAVKAAAYLLDGPSKLAAAKVIDTAVKTAEELKHD